MAGGISRVIQSLLIVYHIGIIRITGKVGRQSGPLILREFGQIAKRQILATGIFAYIVRIVKAHHKKERFGMFPVKESDRSLRQSVVIMRINGRKSKFLIRHGRRMHMPLPGVGTFIAGILHQPAQTSSAQRIGHRHIIACKANLVGGISRKHGRPGRSAQRSRTIGIPKQDTRLCQTVHIGCMQIRIPHATHGRSSLLVGYDINDIRQLLCPSQ